MKPTSTIKSSPNNPITHSFKESESSLGLKNDDNSVNINSNNMVSYIDVKSPFSLGAAKLCYHPDYIDLKYKGHIDIENLRLHYYYPIVPIDTFHTDPNQDSQQVINPLPYANIRLFIITDPNELDLLDYIIANDVNLQGMPAATVDDCPLNYFILCPKDVDDEDNIGTGKKLKRGTVTIVQSKKEVGSDDKK